jgi:hypothetical protein
MKIDFFIAGFQKAATTKIKDLIGRNSHVCLHEIEEMTFFIDEEFETRHANNFLSEYYQCLSEKKIIGAKNVSMIISENSIQRLKQHNSLCKIIVILRNPIKRAYSAYWYCRRMGWEDNDNFQLAINRPLSDYPDGIIRRSCDYVGQGYYAQHLKILQKYFPMEQIKIYILEEDFNNMDHLNNDLCSYLNIPTEYFNQQINKLAVNTSAIPRFKNLASLIRKKSRLSSVIKKIMPYWIVKKIKIQKEKIMKLNEIKFDTPDMTDESYQQLYLLFKEKNQELELMLDRKLTLWDVR